MSQTPAPAPAAAFEGETPEGDPDEKLYSSNDLKRLSQKLYTDFATRIKAELRRESLASESADDLNMRMIALEADNIPGSPRKGFHREQRTVPSKYSKASRCTQQATHE
mmetsp:Transcript_27490/g.82812  ORF Transcript_27490/g.82812 Transcript_27490/m.82812 type:complete len:109 (-) Transcript_27490:18-344(-)